MQSCQTSSINWFLLNNVVEAFASIKRHTSVFKIEFNYFVWFLFHIPDYLEPFNVFPMISCVVPVLVLPLGILRPNYLIMYKKEINLL